MTLTRKLLAATALFAAIATPVFSAQAATDGLALTLAERNTYTNPQGGEWTEAYAMDRKHKMGAKHQGMHRGMHNASMQRSNASWDMNWPVGRTDTNVSPASMDSGIKNLK
jgi:predicted trehalose synthase